MNTYQEFKKEIAVLLMHIIRLITKTLIVGAIYAMVIFVALKLIGFDPSIIGTFLVGTVIGLARHLKISK